MELKIGAEEELSYETYQLRQIYETTKEGLLGRVGNLRIAGNFAFSDGKWAGLPYVGCAIVSMLANNAGNEGVAQQLLHFQSKIKGCFEEENTCYLLPEYSFHQTIANTLSNERYLKHIVSQGLEYDYPHIVSKAMDSITRATETDAISMKLVGLGIFSTAIGILGVFDNEADFQRIMAFRDAIYENRDLKNLTIKRTRPFIGHITLAYLESELSTAEKQQLVDCCVEINQFLTSNPLYFKINQTELRAYKDLSLFETQVHFPKYRFIC